MDISLKLCEQVVERESRQYEVCLLIWLCYQYNNLLILSRDNQLGVYWRIIGLWGWQPRHWFYFPELFLSNCMTLQEIFFPYCHSFTILLCWFGTGYHFRVIVLVFGLWVRSPYRVTITKFWFLLINWLILLSIYRRVRFTTWKNGGYMN